VASAAAGTLWIEFSDDSFGTLAAGSTFSAAIGGTTEGTADYATPDPDANAPDSNADWHARRIRSRHVSPGERGVGGAAGARRDTVARQAAHLTSLQRGGQTPVGLAEGKRRRAGQLPRNGLIA
jgi:hypothetical protein